MTRHEFIENLRRELSKLPQEEIEDAVMYFEECFADATEGLNAEEAASEEERLAGEFGSPKKIATQIRAEYAARLLDGDVVETGDAEPGAGRKLSAVWWIIIGLCSAPVAVPLAICVIAMVIAIYALIIAGVVSGIASVIGGLIKLSTYGAAAVMTLGGGMMLLAVSAAAAYGAFLATRAVIRSIARSVKESNRKKKNDTVVIGEEA